MRGHLAKLLAAAVLAWLSIGTAHAEMVVGFDNLGCIASSNVVTQFDSIEEACSPTTGVRSFKLESEDFANCHVCNAVTPPPPPPPPLPPGTVIVIPACPSGERRHEGGCHADHVCGADQVGGGEEDCRTCGVGLVPNPDGTACQSCRHGESNTSGVCAADPCGIDALDTAAVTALAGIPKEPRERGLAFYCLDDEINATEWSYSSANACAVSVDMRYWDSCWTAGGRDVPCDLASVHTHPCFAKADEGTRCHGRDITEALAIRYNNAGMGFSSRDLSHDRSWRVDGYLGVSDRSCARANRVFSGGAAAVVAGKCTQQPLPHIPWSQQ